MNESRRGDARSNVRGTLAVAHHDVPDCGNSEYFINLQDNVHLDEAYGGYCVFARVLPEDTKSWTTINTIAAQLGSSTSIPVNEVKLLN